MKLTKSHPVSRALRSGMSMKAAWAAYRGGRGHAKRRNGGRRRSRKAHRGHNPLWKLTNPLPSVKGIIAKAKSTVSTENPKKGAAIAGTIGASYVLPIWLAKKGRISGDWVAGGKGIVATGLAGLAAAITTGFVQPSLAPVALSSVAGAVALRVLLTAANNALGISTMMGGFLTLNGMGQLPAGLIAGMGDFLQTNRPIAALPARGLGGGERFSRVN